MSGSRARKAGHVACAALALVGCGASATKDPPTAGVVFAPAPHPPLPRIVSSQGPVLHAPKVVPLTFAGDALAASVPPFLSALAASDYWTQITAQYGTGLLTATMPIQVTDPPPAMWTDGDLQAWLTSTLSSTPGIPQPEVNTIYAVFLPDGTTVTTMSGTSCQQFGGYHADFTLPGGAYVIYAVVPRCPAPVPQASPTDAMTATASHEIAEAATDPLPLDHPAYNQVDADDRAWELIPGGEVGDLCADVPEPWIDLPGTSSIVQKIWSNEAAAASHDPCEPKGQSPYFNAAPVLGDMVTVSDMFGNTLTTKGIRLAVGETKTIELDLFSDAPTSGPWHVSALDGRSTFGGGPPLLSLSLDHDHGLNGDKLHLSITAVAKAPNGATFWLENDLGNMTTFWPGVVQN